MQAVGEPQQRGQLGPTRARRDDRQPRQLVLDAAVTTTRVILSTARWTERRLQRSSLQWTILRNGLYAELFGQLSAPVDGVITAPFQDGALAAVARQDLADVAARVAADPAPHRNHTYELTGPTALTAGELARVLDVPYRPVSLGEQRASLSEAGLLPFQPAMLMSIYSATAAGFLDSTRSDLTDLLDASPRGATAIATAVAAR